MRASPRDFELNLYCLSIVLLGSLFIEQYNIYFLPF